MKVLLFLSCLVLYSTYLVNCQSADPSAVDPQSPPPAPTINWGNCPQLEPKEDEKKEKASIIKICLEAVPVPQNISQETVEIHRAEVAKCALQKEGWFNEHGEYKYEKAENEIKKKQLNSQIEEKMLSQHAQCKQEAESKFGRLEEVIAQIQLYQACMDYHISSVCGIQISYPNGEAPRNRRKRWTKF